MIIFFSQSLEENKMRFGILIAFSGLMAINGNASLAEGQFKCL